MRNFHFPTYSYVRHEPFVHAALFVAFVGFWLLTHLRWRLATLREIAKRFGGEIDPLRQRMSGTIDGRAVKIRFSRPRVHPVLGRSSCTQVEIAMRPTELALEVRPQTSREVAAVNRGRAVDLQVGEVAFDAAFVVEAAPADHAIALLDGPMRAALLALHPITVIAADDKIAVVDWGLPAPARAIELIELAGRLAAAVPDAAERVQAGLEQRAVRIGAPYRQGADLGVLRAVAIAREVELATLASVKARRFRRLNLMCGAAAALMAVLIVLDVIWACRSR